MASESKKPRVEKPEEDSSTVMISDIPTEPTQGIVKEELYKLPLGDNIDFTIKSHLTDTAFIIDGKKIYAGSDFLSILSPFFNALLKGRFAESKKDEIELKDVTYDEFREMLQYLSNASREIDALKVESLLILSDLYDIKWLADRAEEFLISTKEFLVSSKLLLADRYRLIKLQMKCWGSLNNKERRDFMKSEEYEQLSETAKRQASNLAKHVYLGHPKDMREVKKVEEPANGFIALGAVAVEHRTRELRKNPSLELVGIDWEFEVFDTDGGETFDVVYKTSQLFLNNCLMSTVEWSVEGFVEAEMNVLELDEGKELRSMKKTYAFEFNNRTSKCEMDTMMESLIEDDDEYEWARDFLNYTIYITRTSGLRSGPNFDFTVPSELTDVAFIVEGRKVHVNRQYMSVISPRLFEIFYDSDEVEVKNVEYKDFIQFLHWIYPSQRRYLTSSWLFSTLKIARQLGVDIDTSVIERYFTVGNENVLYLERMIFFFEFNIGDRNKLKEGVWYGLREENCLEPSTKLNGAFVLLEKCPLYSKMSPERKVDLYRWMLTEEYDL